MTLIRNSINILHLQGAFVRIQNRPSWANLSIEKVLINVYIISIPILDWNPEGPSIWKGCQFITSRRSFLYVSAVFYVMPWSQMHAKQYPNRLNSCG